MTATLEFYPAVKLCVLMGANPEKRSPHMGAVSQAERYSQIVFPPYSFFDD
jgi:hypothetical protein